jgi:dienelactone hydrolase
MDPPARTPTGLTHVPSGLDGLAAVVLFYPFCGPGSLAREGGWRHAAPALMLLAGADAVVSTPDCLAAADRVRQGGRPIDVHVYPATPHAFDQRSPRDRADARARVSAFLRRAVGPAPR